MLYKGSDHQGLWFERVLMTFVGRKKILFSVEIKYSQNKLN